MKETENKIRQDFYRKILEVDDKESLIRLGKSMMSQFSKNKQSDEEIRTGEYERIYSFTDKLSALISFERLKKTFVYYMWVKYHPVQFFIGLLSFVATVFGIISYIPTKEKVCDIVSTPNSRGLLLSFFEDRSPRDNSEVLTFTRSASESFNLNHHRHYTENVQSTTINKAQQHRINEKALSIDSFSKDCDIDIFVQIQDLMNQDSFRLITNKSYPPNFLRDKGFEISTSEFLDYSYYDHDENNVKHNFSNFSLPSNCACILARSIAHELKYQTDNYEFLDSLLAAEPKVDCPENCMLKGTIKILWDQREGYLTSLREEDIDSIRNEIIELVKMTNDSMMIALAFNEVAAVYEEFDNKMMSSNTKETSMSYVPDNHILRMKNYQYLRGMIEDGEYFDQLAYKDQLDLLVRANRDCQILKNKSGSESLELNCFDHLIDEYPLFDIYASVYDRQSKLLSDSSWQIQAVSDSELTVEFPFAYKSNTRLLNREKWSKDIAHIFKVFDEHDINDIRIYGHASIEGPEWLNNSLGLERAKEIRKYGNPEKARVISKGAKEVKYESQSRNRRAEIVIKK